ncbi:hypothetical protein EDI_163030 [Entamoeba dispar SAW760]|uniref:Uncharacterized protein n=1 Tax=Entamoeba dispar (strain ATCC PRA-260 / SAW760) TaxID=370354 RepID=B0ECQ4_ENTDS|nr:uncharacterized protein EDI_163030 [Entamoeba dispar SAW760]EDR27691.1 hypothetical protein EDI_163030 [Entamoeba dispar SAW760]|eukprot:EDR27691.1 hypothetical protein EDI_163030 [Entamoeba dispar SAW760]
MENNTFESQPTSDSLVGGERNKGEDEIEVMKLWKDEIDHKKNSVDKEISDTEIEVGIETSNGLEEQELVKEPQEQNRIIKKFEFKVYTKNQPQYINLINKEKEETKPRRSSFSNKKSIEIIKLPPFNELKLPRLTAISSDNQTSLNQNIQYQQPGFFVPQSEIIDNTQEMIQQKEEFSLYPTVSFSTDNEQYDYCNSFINQTEQQYLQTEQQYRINDEFSNSLLIPNKIGININANYPYQILQMNRDNSITQPQLLQNEILSEQQSYLDFNSLSTYIIDFCAQNQNISFQITDSFIKLTGPNNTCLTFNQNDPIDPLLHFQLPIVNDSEPLRLESFSTIPISITELLSLFFHVN